MPWKRDSRYVEPDRTFLNFKGRKAVVDDLFLVQKRRFANWRGALKLENIRSGNMDGFFALLWNHVLVQGKEDIDGDSVPVGSGLGEHTAKVAGHVFSVFHGNWDLHTEWRNIKTEIRRSKFQDIFSVWNRTVGTSNNSFPFLFASILVDIFCLYLRPNTLSILQPETKTHYLTGRSFMHVPNLYFDH